LFGWQNERFKKHIRLDRLFSTDLFYARRRYLDSQRSSYHSE